MSSSSHPMTAAQLGALKARLVARRAALRTEITAKLNAQDDPALLGLQNRIEDRDDWAVADLETALDVAEVSRDAAELQDVEAAIGRMDAGTFGNCVTCGSAIPLARLEANPMAARCIACQEKREAAMRHSGAGTM